MAQLERDGRVFASELSRLYKVSDDTVRRDLDVLAEQGMIHRVHGGALRRLTYTESFEDRQAEGAAAKDVIGQATASLLRSGQVIFIDGGTTSLAIVRHLPPDFAGTIITTSPPIAVALAPYASIELVLIGGRLYRYAMVAVGAETVAQVRAIHTDVCILGVLALHPAYGVSVRDYEEAQVKRAMIATASRVIAPTIGEKLGTVAAFHVAAASTITDLVTEATVPSNLLTPYHEAGVTIHRV
ncbi:MAG: DeoR/GlpR family DNA-binding transcription regulator [Ktedonobacterales bacterium]